MARFNKINPETLEKQYKHYLSNFFDWLPKHNTEALVFPENLGRKVTIDETALTNGELYTVVTNKERNKKGKLIAIVKGTKANVVNSALAQIPFADRMGVEEITADLDNSMDWICRESFCNSLITADRFHVQKLVIEAVQEMRIELRRSASKEENKGQETRYENGDTKKQLLARSRYLLFKSRERWTKSQSERAQILFREYPELKEGYELYLNFRDIFELKQTRQEAQAKLLDWIEKVNLTELEQLKDSAKTIERNLGKILNYFVNRETNASAESFNAKLKGFRALLRGVRDTDFFLFRVCKLYA